MDLMIEQKCRTYEIEKGPGDKEEKEEQTRELEEELLGKWQKKWETEDPLKAKWTKILIKDIESWTNRSHGEVSYELCQFLTGCGHFGKFQHTI